MQCVSIFMIVQILCYKVCNCSYNRPLDSWLEMQSWINLIHLCNVISLQEMIMYCMAESVSPSPPPAVQVAVAEVSCLG